MRTSFAFMEMLIFKCCGPLDSSDLAGAGISLQMLGLITIVYFPVSLSKSTGPLDSDSCLNDSYHEGPVSNSNISD